MSTPTPRELEILRAYVERASVKEAGAQLGISEQAAKNSLRHLYERLGVHSAFEATIALGWMTLPPAIPQCGLVGRCSFPAGHRGPHLAAAA